MKPLCLSALCVLLCLLGACSRNQFSLEGRISGGEASTLYMSWRAASGKQDLLASQAVPLTSGPFQITGPMKRPTVIWVFSSGRKLLTAIYVERGDKLTLQGDMNAPALWQVKGNDVMEEVSVWQSANEKVLRGTNPRAVNEAVARFVRSSDNKRAALLLLFTRFDRTVAPAQFSQLLATFTDKKLLAEMRAACLEPGDASALSLPADRSARIRQVLAPDSVDSDSAGRIPEMQAPQVDVTSLKTL